VPEYFELPHLAAESCRQLSGAVVGDPAAAARPIAAGALPERRRLRRREMVCRFQTQVVQRISVMSSTKTPRPSLLETHVRICVRAAPPAAHSDIATARPILLNSASVGFGPVGLCHRPLRHPLVSAGSGGVAQLMHDPRHHLGSLGAAGRRIITTTRVTTVSGTTKPIITPEKACSASCC